MSLTIVRRKKEEAQQGLSSDAKFHIFDMNPEKDYYSLVKSQDPEDPLPVWRKGRGMRFEVQMMKPDWSFFIGCADLLDETDSAFMVYEEGGDLCGFYVEVDSGFYVEDDKNQAMTQDHIIRGQES